MGGGGGEVKGFQNTHNFKLKAQGTKAVFQFILNQSDCAKLALKLGIAKLQIQGLSHRLESSVFHINSEFTIMFAKVKLL